MEICLMAIAWAFQIAGIIIAVLPKSYYEAPSDCFVSVSALVDGIIIFAAFIYSIVAKTHLSHSVLYAFCSYFVICLQGKKALPRKVYTPVFFIVSILFLAVVSACFGVCYYEAEPGIIYENEYYSCSSFLLKVRETFNIPDFVILYAIYIVVGFISFFSPPSAFLSSDIYFTQHIVAGFLGLTLVTWLASFIMVKIGPSLFNERYNTPPE